MPLDPFHDEESSRSPHSVEVQEKFAVENHGLLEGPRKVPTQWILLWGGLGDAQSAVKPPETHTIDAARLPIDLL